MTFFMIEYLLSTLIMMTMISTLWSEQKWSVTIPWVRERAVRLRTGVGVLVSDIQKRGQVSRPGRLQNRGRDRRGLGQKESAIEVATEESPSLTDGTYTLYTDTLQAWPVWVVSTVHPPKVADNIS